MGGEHWVGLSDVGENYVRKFEMNLSGIGGIEGGKGSGWQVKLGLRGGGGGDGWGHWRLGIAAKGDAAQDSAVFFNT